MMSGYCFRYFYVAVFYGPRFSSTIELFRENPIPDPEFPGSLITTKKVMIDALHWDNENLILDMPPGERDIHLKSDPKSPVEE